MHYYEAINEIFSSYMSYKKLAGRPPHLHEKDLHVIERAIKELDLAPLPNKTIKVTGSKGKGTATKTISNTLSRNKICKVATYLSPEENEHTDRMRINNEPISQLDFVRLYQSLKPKLKYSKRTTAHGKYISPYGVFLLVALMWFKENKVDACVIECGRGVRYDESNLILSRLGVITSIFEEHIGILGKNATEIYQDKICIAETSETVCVPEGVADFDLPKNAILIPRTRVDIGIDSPEIYRESYGFSLKVSELFLKTRLHPSLADFSSSSFEGIIVDGVNVILDGTIHRSGLDLGWLARHKDMIFFVCFPDGKDGRYIIRELMDSGITLSTVRLNSQTSDLTFEQLDYSSNKPIDISIEKPPPLNFFLEEGHERLGVVFMGTQSFLRTVRKILRD